MPKSGMTTRAWALTLGGAACLVSSRGESCAIFPGNSDVVRRHSPSMSVEQTLIVFDEATNKEHFVREIAFHGVAARFGFVVPTPDLPEVTSVAHAPFVPLAGRYPVHAPEPPPPKSPPRSMVSAAAASEPSDSVRVLSKGRVGSFTSFVLAATNAAAMKTWLSNNDFATTPESDAWLAHYVKLGFYYAALRYDPPAGAKPSDEVRAETIRITFPTPLPYYPYFEPTSKTETHPRELAVWLVAQHRYIPVSPVDSDGSVTWRQPFMEWRKWTDFDPGVLGPNLTSLAVAPKPTLQTFEDQKSHRDGWGDIVFVPANPTPVDDAKWPAYAKLMAALDPSYRSAP